MGLKRGQIAVLVTTSAGCSAPLPAIAWRGGDAAWPAHGPAAVAASLEMGADVHAQVWLAGDRQPLIWGAPRLDPQTCETIGGRDITEDVWLVEHPADVLIAGWRCGARPDPAHPDAALAAAPLMTLEQLLGVHALAVQAARTAGDRPSRLLLDLGYFINVAHDPTVIAAEVVERWRAADHPDVLTVMSAEPAVLDAVAARAAQAGVEVEVWLWWPTVPPLAGDDLWAAGAALGQAAGLVSPARRAEAVHAEGVAIPLAAAERTAVEAAAAAGLRVQLGPIDDATQALALRSWPIDAVFVHDPRPDP